MIEEAKNLIHEKEKKEGIQRLLRHRDIDIYPFSPSVISPARLFYPYEKIKVINLNYQQSLISDVEALRFALENSIQKKFISCNRNLNLLDLPLPQFCIPGHYEIAYYFDIKRCFYSIYSAFGIDCRCKIEFSNIVKVLSIGKGYIDKSHSIINALENQKQLRNAIYGFTRVAHITVRAKNLKIYRNFIKTKLQNFELHALIALILNTIFNRMKNLVYFNIDGGFTLSKEDIDNVLEIAEMLNLKIESKRVTNLKISRLGGYEYTDDINKKVSGLYDVGNGNRINRTIKIQNEKEFLTWLKKLK